MANIKKVEPADSEVQAFVGALDKIQSALYPAESNHLDSLEELCKSNVYFAGAFENDLMVGCGAVKITPDGYGEIKRMYVDPAARGRGTGKQILQALEDFLVASGVAVARLETGVLQKEALALYENNGYLPTEPFGRYAEDPLSVFMEKRLATR